MGRGGSVGNVKTKMAGTINRILSSKGFDAYKVVASSIAPTLSKKSTANAKVDYLVKNNCLD